MLLKLIDYKTQNEMEAKITDVVSPGTLKVVLDQLFLECEHGDAEHRQWLKDKFEDYRRRYEDLCMLEDSNVSG